MRKTTRWTAVFGILAAVLLAAGGLVFVRGLLERQTHRVLSRSGLLPMAEEPQADGEDSRTPAGLKRDELRQVLLSMEQGETEALHEPFGRQLSMREAVERGQQWAEDFYGQYIRPDLGPEEISARMGAAVLAAKSAPEGQVDQMEEQADLPEELYSYWTVTYQPEDALINLRLNAVTGEVLWARIESYLPEEGEIDLDRIINAYADSFSAEKDFTKTGEDLRELCLDGGAYFAQLRVNSVHFFEASEEGDEREAYKVILLLYLSTEP